MSVDSIVIAKKVKRYALQYDPPLLIIEYEDLIKQKKYIRKIKFKVDNIHNSSAEIITNRIINKNHDILSINKVSYEQLVDLINLLLFHDNSINSTNSDDPRINILTSNQTVIEMISPNKYNNKLDLINGHIDLNKVSDEENKIAKELMSKEYEKNIIKPTDKDFIYDKRIEFDTPKEVSEWDEDDDDND